MKEKKQMQQGGEEMDLRTAKVYKESRTKHDSINLPRNVCYSDDSDAESTSEDDNYRFTQDSINFHETSHKLDIDKLSHPFENFSLNEEESLPISEEALTKFSELSLEDKYKKVLEILLLLVEKSSSQTDSIDKDLKARSPFRNRVNLHKQTLYDRPDLTVTTHLGNIGNVYVQKLSVITQPSIISRPVANYTVEALPQENDVFNCLNNQTFCEMFLDMIEQMYKNEDNVPEASPDTQQMVSFDQNVISPLMSSPATSPNSSDLYDSSYETGSPGSTVGTSPAPRISISSDSDMELDPSIENQTVPTNIVFFSSQPVNQLILSGKPEPVVKPLGEPIHFFKISATQRLHELSKSTTFCKKHYAIQLVKVVLISNAETSEDRLQGFSKSLMGTMSARLNKAHEGDIWQLSLYAHIEFLTAKDRMDEYRSTLLVRDEHRRSLLYIAAVERYEKHLIARYVAESLAKVGYNPLEVYEKGNTILHVLANLGDSHKDVLSELLMATGADGKPLLDVSVTNAEGQSALHTAALSPHRHISTMLLLLRMNGNAFQEDNYKKSPLYYHMRSMSKFEPRNKKDVEVIRKMMQAQPIHTKETLQMLDELCSDSSLPSDLIAVVQDEMKTCVRDVRLKKGEQH